VIVIDEFALGDPLLARLPVATPAQWRIGHFRRAVPEGYLRARASGDTREMQPDLARYWEEIRLVVSGPLLSPGRLRAIARLNTGADEGLRDAYLRSLAGPRG
jgi:arabinofuranosyltransferase